jgi:hypothetical protein
MLLYVFDVRNLASQNLKGATSMKRFVITVALVCVLSVSALAGEVPTGGAPQPPAGIGRTTSETSQGLIPTVGYMEQMSDAALSSLLVVLGLVSRY